MSDKALPADINAERATLGAILLDRDAIIFVAPWLFAEYFYLDTHGAIYAAQLACYNRRVPPDLVNVTDELRRQDRLDAVGGVAYLIALSNSVPTSLHIEYYARIIERTALLRRTITAGGTIAALAFDETMEVEEVLNRAEAELLDITKRRARRSYVTMSQAVDVVYNRIERLKEAGKTLTGIPTGFSDFDRKTGGLQKSDLLYLAARPAVGKTSLALNIAQHAATLDHTVAVFSLEMGYEQLVQRMLAAHTGIDMQRLRTGDIPDDSLYRLTEGLGHLSTLPIIIDDAGSATIMDVRSKARRIQAEQGLDLIIIDYVQLMQGGGRKDGNRVQEISEISRGLKQMARELDVPVLALSQLSRAVESRTSKVPLLSDLRDSGSLEQDADLVIFIHREELYDPDTDKKGMAELHIAKHRNGPTGVVPLRFFTSTTRFAPMETFRVLEDYA